jgi:hypothetical protein
LKTPIESIEKRRLRIKVQHSRKAKEKKDIDWGAENTDVGLPLSSRQSSEDGC